MKMRAFNGNGGGDRGRGLWEILEDLEVFWIPEHQNMTESATNRVSIRV